MQAPARALAQEAEQAVLGAVLIDPEALALAVDAGLRADHFASSEHAEIWRQITRAQAAGQAHDMVSVFSALQEAGRADAIGGLPYLNELVLQCDATKAAGVFARTVIDAATRRGVARLAEQLRAAAAAPGQAGAWMDSLTAVEEGLRAVRSGQLQRSRLPFELLADGVDLDAAPRQLVEGLLSVGALAMVYGESNSGKSYLAIELGLSVANGAPYLGRRTDRNVVLYVAAEGSWSVRLRVAAGCRFHKRTPGLFGLVPMAINLLDPSADVDALIELITAKAAELGAAVGLVVVDTLARVMVGGDENDAEDMGRLIAAGERIRQSTGAAVLFIHHAGKDAGRGARGHSSLRAALDTEFIVSADEALKLHHLKVSKQRDLSGKGETFTVRLVPVELGVDQWSNPITACAVVQVETEAKGQPRPRMTPAQLAVMGYMAGQERGVKRAEIVTALEPQGVSRPSVYRAVNDLVMAGLLAVVGMLVYLVKEGPSHASQSSQ